MSEDIGVELIQTTIYWACGHVTFHGNAEPKITRCVICSCDRLKRALFHEVSSEAREA